MPLGSKAGVDQRVSRSLFTSMRAPGGPSRPGWVRDTPEYCRRDPPGGFFYRAIETVRLARFAQAREGRCAALITILSIPPMPIGEELLRRRGERSGPPSAECAFPSESPMRARPIEAEAQ